MLPVLRNARKTGAVSSTPRKESADCSTGSWRASAPFALSGIVSVLVAAMVPAVVLSQAVPSGPPRVEAIRYWSFGDVTRVAIQTRGAYKLTTDQVDTPARVYFDLTGLLPPAAAHHGVQSIAVGDHRLRQIRVAEVSPGKTRIVFDLEGPVEVSASQLVNPDRLMVELRPKGTSLPSLSVAHSVTGSRQVDIYSDAAASISPASTTAGSSPLNTPPLSAVPVTGGPALSPVVPPKSGSNTEPAGEGCSTTSTSTAAAPVPESGSCSVGEEIAAPHASKISLVPATPNVSPRTSGTPSPAKKDSAGDRSLVRVFGLKMGKVVIDPGHGGSDTGTIGPNGLLEKDLVLDIALRLGKLITKQLGAEVVYTRSDNTFIPLEARTRIANEQKADLFISIHANSSPEPNATGVETYFFNLNADKAGLDVATRENATSTSSISDLNELLHKAVLQTKLEESREFAQRVQAALWASSLKMNGRSRDRGVRQAPFVVLIGATMPSILAEVGFISNPHDERLLKKTDQRERIAEALYKGIAQYASSLSHIQMARAGSE